MTDSEDHAAPKVALRAVSGGPAADAARWRPWGLLLGAMVAVVIAMVTLSPPAGAPPLAPGLDKVFHAAGFAALVFPMILTDTRRWLWVVPLAIAYGGAIELMQPSVGRSAEWLDWGADISGVLAGAALGEMLHDRFRRGVSAPNAGLAPSLDLEKRQIEAMRAELIEDMRGVLREELASMQRPPEAPPPPPQPRHPH